MNKKVIKILLMIFVVLIVFSSSIKSLEIAAIDIVRDEKEESIFQIIEKLDVVHKILLIILSVVCIVHIIKSKRVMIVIVYSLGMLMFSYGLGMPIYGGLDMGLSYADLIKPIFNIIIDVIFIYIHFAFIRKILNTDKENVQQDNK